MLGDLVASFADRGERSALVRFRRDGSDVWSYARLAEQSGRAASQLLESGIGRGDRVALLGPNGPEWVVAYFGIVLAGAVAVPLDPQSTLDGTVAALGRAAPKAVVTTRSQRDALAPLVGQSVQFRLLDGDDVAASLRDVSQSGEPSRIDGRDLASLLFTSGTTGTPKAVALTHDNFATDLNALLAARLMAADDRVLLPLPLHHTYPFTVGLLTTLASGAAVVFPAGISGPEILDAVKQGRATALLAVPRLCTALWDGIEAAVQARGATAAAAFRALLAVSIALRRHIGLRVGRRLFAGIHSRFGGTLELIGCGGAKLSADLAWRLEGLGFRVLTGYGLTETSPVLTFNSPQQSRLGSEGRPLPGVELRIAGDSAATPNEILARGRSVFTGYWNNAEATAAAFTPDGWFRTGDLGRFDDAGYLYVVGRSKELIVLADGKKFFPEAVEKVYAQSALLKEIGVFERDGALAAVVVPNEDEIRARGALRETAALREAIEDAAARLPPYQRITTYRLVRSALPRTQLGKLRRHLLPDLFDGGERRSSDRAPATEADRALLATPLAGAVWHWLSQRYPTQALSLDTSPQLELGIDSLGWVALTAELERQFGVALRAEQLARILTLRDLLQEIEGGARSTSAAPAAATDFVEPALAQRLLGAALFAAVRLLVRLVFRPGMAGMERLPPGPVLIAPNHASYLDPLVVAAALPWQRLRHTYWAGWVGVMHTTPLRRLMSRAAQVFPVDPDRDLAASVRTARQLLERGYTIVWFPEGRRSPDGRLQQFQLGVTALLRDEPLSVVPAAITGTFAAWPKHRRWPRRSPIGIVFGTPLVLGAELDPQSARETLEIAVKELLSSASRVPDSQEQTPWRSHRPSK